jgi:hypothetical protein
MPTTLLSRLKDMAAEHEDIHILHECVARLTDMHEVLEAVELLHGSAQWDGARQKRWKEIIGRDECTPEVLCAHVRWKLREG